MYDVKNLAAANKIKKKIDIFDITKVDFCK